jgi:hypothetical protein
MTPRKVNERRMTTVGKFLTLLAPHCERIVTVMPNQVSIYGYDAANDDLIETVARAAALLHAPPVCVEKGDGHVVFEVTGTWADIRINVWTRLATRPVGVPA